MVDMLLLVLRLDKILAAVDRVVQIDVRVIEAIELVWTGPDFLVIVRSRAAGNILTLLHPGLTAVF